MSSDSVGVTVALDIAFISIIDFIVAKQFAETPANVAFEESPKPFDYYPPAIFIVCHNLILINNNGNIYIIV